LTSPLTGAEKIDMIFSSLKIYGRADLKRGGKMTKKEIELAVIDDDENILRTTVYELKNSVDSIANVPIDVEDVNTIEKAYDLISTEMPDIVILDVYLKDGQNTLELVKKCHSQGIKPLWVVHSSEWRQEDTKAKFAHLGVTRGVNKLDFEGIKTIIVEYLKNPPLADKNIAPARLHELPQDIRLEEFYDYLMGLTTVDLALHAFLKSNSSPKLKKIERNLFKEIEKLRDFVLYE